MKFSLLQVFEVLNSFWAFETVEAHTAISPKYINWSIVEKNAVLWNKINT